MTYLMLGTTPGRRRGTGRVLAALAILVVALVTWFILADRVEKSAPSDGDDAATVEGGPGAPVTARWRGGVAGA